MQSPADPRITAALERNDRYVREFIEAFTLCPYARRTRESGMLHRVVVLEAGGAPQAPGFEAAVAALATAIEGVEALPADSVDVALVILPVLAPELSKGIEGARAFEQLVSAPTRSAPGKVECCIAWSYSRLAALRRPPDSRLP